MYMNRVWNIAIMIAVVAATALFVSCKNETDTQLNTQQSTIQKYLENSHQPRLIAEEEIANSLENEPQFYTHWGLDIFRYISTYYAEGRSDKPSLEAGDKAAISYTAYIFKSGTPTTSDMFATNEQESIDALTAQGLNTTYEWTTEPMEITLGSGDILDSLATALEGCHEGDSVEVYLTFEAAYGNKYIGKVPPKSAQMWKINIISVTKKQ